MVTPHPIQLPQLGTAQLAVNRVVPPVSGRVRGALGDADRSIKLAGSRPEPPAFRHEWRAVPVDLNQPSSGCPVISIPQAGVHSHALLVRVRDPLLLVVSEHSDWQPVDIPPEINFVELFELQLFDFLETDFFFFFLSYQLFRKR